MTILECLGTVDAGIVTKSCNELVTAIVGTENIILLVCQNKKHFIAIFSPVPVIIFSNFSNH